MKMHARMILQRSNTVDSTKTMGVIARRDFFNHAKGTERLRELDDNLSHSLSRVCLSLIGDDAAIS